MAHPVRFFTAPPPELLPLLLSFSIFHLARAQATISATLWRATFKLVTQAPS